ncbi:cell division protein FtsQ/DivIB [Lacticaseibacillus porcinae]|uniref:cell division protein FtsQ/DivIB n=1 Tax=Lacticaseibacillus porcinae TaxID=1123687 RepID=UPI000F781E15|nr:cell division protein FtsQ/DivIB [Lacticaseibacillus porcinae]
MPFWRKSKSQDPLTPWEAYQAKQKREQKAASHPLPLPHLTKTRTSRRRRNLALILTPLTVLLVIAIYFMTPLARVGDINVRGESTLPAQSVIDASKLGPSQMILDLLMHQKRVSQRVQKALPQVQSMSLSIKGFNQVTLHVHEYAPLGYVQKNGEYHVLLASSVVVKDATQTPKSTYPIFTGFTNKEAFDVAKTVASFPQAVRKAVSEVKATRGAANPYQITISMSNGNLVIADSRTVAKKIKYYPQLLADVKTKGTVDLEVGAFFTPYAK